MEFLEQNPNEKKKAARLLSNFDDQVTKLRKTDVESFRRKIEEAADIEAKSKHMRYLLEENVPASVDLLEWLLQRSKNDKLLYLEWMSHRQHVAMSLESFTKARSFAEDAHSMAKELYEKLKENSSDFTLPRKPVYKAYIKACVNLLLVCRYQGNITDAQAYLEEAQSVAMTEEDKEDEHLLLILKGDILLAKGQLNNAIEIFNPLLRSPTISLSNKGLLLQKLGNACRSAAQWGAAKEHLRKSIKIAQDLEDEISEFDRVTDLGNVYRSEGRIADALEQQVPHMAFAFKRGDLWGLTVACFNMGFAHYSITPNPDLKRALILLALKHDLAIRTENEPLRGMALNNLGKTFCALGQYEVALKVMKESVKVAQKTLNIAGEGMAYGNIGTAYRSLGKYDDAIENHNKYLQNATGRGDDGGAAIMQRELAIDYICKGDLDNAEKQVLDAISTLETIRNKLGGEDASKIANFDKNQSETYNLMQVILCRKGKHSEALALSELARSRALTDLIRDKVVKSSGVQEETWIHTANFYIRKQELAKDIISHYIKTSDELNTNFLVYSVLKDYDLDGSAQLCLYTWVVLNETSANGKNRINFKRLTLNDNVQDELLVDNRFFSSLTRSFRNISGDGSVLNISAKCDKKVQPEPADETVRVKMPEGPDVEKLLQLLESLSLRTTTAPTTNKTAQNGEDKSLTRNASHSPEDLEANTEDKQMDERAEIVLERVLDCGSWLREGIKQLLQLYEICIAPINEYLPEEKDGVVPNITIIPHEFLFSVPFCCLHDGKNEYLVERFVLSYAPSFRALLLLNQRLKHLKLKQGSRKLKLLAMGNPTMVCPDTPDLPSSGEEARNVQEVFGSDICQLALGNDATKRLLFQEMKNVDILHVATHARPQDAEADDDKSQGDYSMRGCLLLATSEEDYEGAVNASEIASTDCRCQLVTLSCCETGLGKVTGDGVVGLYRAFFAAGAASVLVTLWKIGDDITLIFMDHFYKEFKTTGNVSSSLRSAMLHCIREKKLPPQQWAAFSYIGAIF